MAKVQFLENQDLGEDFKPVVTPEPGSFLWSKNKQGKNTLYFCYTLDEGWVQVGSGAGLVIVDNIEEADPSKSTVIFNNYDNTMYTSDGENFHKVLIDVDSLTAGRNIEIGSDSDNNTINLVEVPSINEITNEIGNSYIRATGFSLELGNGHATGENAVSLAYNKEVFQSYNGTGAGGVNFTDKHDWIFTGGGTSPQLGDIIKFQVGEVVNYSVIDEIIWDEVQPDSYTVISRDGFSCSTGYGITLFTKAYQSIGGGGSLTAGSANATINLNNPSMVIELTDWVVDMTSMRRYSIVGISGTSNPYNIILDRHAEFTGNNSLTLYRLGSTPIGGATGPFAFNEGYKTTARGNCSHAEGDSTTASGSCSHAEGNITIASGGYSHAEGRSTNASGYYSHAEGISTTVSGNYSHAEGRETTASGDSSHAEGLQTTAKHRSQHAFGEYNIADPSLNSASNRGTYVEIVGNGADENTRSNARTLDWSGNETLAGNLTIGGTITSNGQQILPQKQADWNQTTSTESDYILNKPAIKAGQGENSIIEGDLAGNSSIGNYSHAEGNGTTASGKYSHAEGYQTQATGQQSHAEGYQTAASSPSSHAEGAYTGATGSASHSEGYGAQARGINSHAEGAYTEATGDYSHVEGLYTKANHKSQHVFGEFNIADPSLNSSNGRGNYVEIVGNGATSSAMSNARTLDWSGNETLAGNLTIGGTIRANGQQILPQKQADWNQTTSTGPDYIKNKPALKAGQGVNSIIEGSGTTAGGENSHAEGNSTKASGNYSHAEGNSTKASGNYSHAEGQLTTASGQQSHVEGNSTTASSASSHAEGTSTTASGNNSHAEGGGTKASGYDSHAEGQETTASGTISHAEGYNTTASGDYSHAEGGYTTASGSESHAEGGGTTASGQSSHAEGGSTTASGQNSHAEGTGTTAKHRSQHAFGEYNIADPSLNNASTRGTYIEIVGNGTTTTNLSNARTLDWSGNEVLAGTITANGVNLNDELNLKQDALEFTPENVANKKTSLSENSDTYYPTQKAVKTAVDAKADDTKVAAIQGLIPTLASPTNQLADKDFVNSSIGTSTAMFRGTFTSVDNLPTTGVDNNDYAFVKIFDPIQTAEVLRYDRYKWSDGWSFEYSLNNSSFTAAQWDAINSNATASIISDLLSHASNISNPHAVTKSQVGLGDVDNTSDLNKPLSTAAVAEFATKQDALGFTPENVANKKTTLDDNSDTYYPTQKAVKTAVDAKVDGPTSSVANTLPAFADETGRLLKGDTGVSIVDGEIIAGGVNINSAIAGIPTQISNALTLLDGELAFIFRES